VPEGFMGANLFSAAHPVGIGFPFPDADFPGFFAPGHFPPDFFPAA
jgi:hypothetical protein